MKHITILYGAPETGKEFICNSTGWLYISGTPEEIKIQLESNLIVDEIGVPITQDSELTKPIRVVVHAHAKMYGYIIRYIDLRVYN